MNNQVLENIEKWLPRIKNLSRRYKNSICSADDLTQEGILSIIKNIDKFDKTKGELEPFIFVCLRNQIQHSAFQNSFAVNIPSGNLTNDKDYSKYRSISAENIEFPIIDSNIALIEWRDFIQSVDRENMASMYFFDQMNMKEIADITDMSISAVCRHINKVKRLVKEELIYDT